MCKNIFFFPCPCVLALACGFFYYLLVFSIVFFLPVITNVAGILIVMSRAFETSSSGNLDLRACDTLSMFMFQYLYSLSSINQFKFGADFDSPNIPCSFSDVKRMASVDQEVAASGFTPALQRHLEEVGAVVDGAVLPV